MKFSLFLFFLLLQLDCYSQIEIVLSSRFFHPAKESDTLNTLEALTFYQADRLDWMYYNRKNIPLDSLKKRNIKFSLTLNPMVPDSLYCTTINMRMVDLKGNPYIAPWMRNLDFCNLYWGCVNNPEFKTLFLKKSKEIIDLGAEAIMVDDSRFNDQAVGNTGENCFCEHCMIGFNHFLLSKKEIFPAGFNYKEYRLGLIQKSNESNKLLKLFIDFQKESVISFLNEWKKEVKYYSNNHIRLITNNYNAVWNNFYLVFDEGMAELNVETTTIKTIDESIKNAESHNKKQTFSYASESISDVYKCYLHTYLQGASSLVPWDLYLGSTTEGKIKRLYTSSEQFVTLIKFMKSHPDFFSGKNSNTVLPGIQFEDSSITRSICFDKKSYYIFAYNDLKNDNALNIQISNKKYRVDEILPDLFISGKKRIKRTTTYTGKLILLKITPKRINESTLF